MAKAWAKIVVRVNYDLGEWWSVWLASDLIMPSTILHECVLRRGALARARAWSRRLGNIPVEVDCAGTRGNCSGPVKYKMED